MPMIFFMNIYANEKTLDISTEKIIYTHIQRINKLAFAKKYDEALTLNRKYLVQYPDSTKLHLLYAKLLFWHGKIFKAKQEIENYKHLDQKLYRNIYITWALRTLSGIKNPHKKLLFIQKLDAFAKESYDVSWIKMQSLIETKHLKKALQTAKLIVSHYPKSLEAKERSATLLFWNKKYRQSLYAYQQISLNNHYSVQIKKLQNILSTKKKKSTSYTVTTPKLVKKEVILPAPKIDSKKMLGVGKQVVHYSDSRYIDSTSYFESTVPIDAYTLYFKILNTNRYGLNDKKIEGEFYPLLPSPQWGYLSFSYTPNADFFNDYSLGWHHFYGWKEWEFSLGYDWKKYKIESINLLSAGYSYYFNGLQSLQQVAYFVPDNNSWAFRSMLKYKTSKHTEYYVEYIVAHSNEKIQRRDFILGTDTKHLQMGGEYPISSHFTIGGNIGKEWIKDQRDSYIRKYFEYFIRYYW